MAVMLFSGASLFVNNSHFSKPAIAITARQKTNSTKQKWQLFLGIHGPWWLPDREWGSIIHRSALGFDRRKKNNQILIY